MLTIETFSPENRDKQIGYSQYRISADEPGEKDDPHNWYISEHYNNPETGEWAQARTRKTTSLKEAIDWLNGISKEREIIDKELRGRWEPHETANHMGEARKRDV